MPGNKPPQSGIILYQTEDGRTRIQSWFDNQTIWLTQALIAEQLQITGELSERATCKESLQVAHRRAGANSFVNFASTACINRAAAIRKFRIARPKGKRNGAHDALLIAGALPWK